MEREANEKELLEGNNQEQRLSCYQPEDWCEGKLTNNAYSKKLPINAQRGI